MKRIKSFFDNWTLQFSSNVNMKTATVNNLIKEFLA